MAERWANRSARRRRRSSAQRPRPLASGRFAPSHRPRLPRPPVAPPRLLGRAMAIGRRARLPARPDLAARPQRMARGRPKSRARRRARASCPPPRSTSPTSKRCSPTRSRPAREVRFDPATAAISATKGRRLGAIRLSSAPDPKPDQAAIEAGLLDAVRRHGLAILPWPESAHRAAPARRLRRQRTTQSIPDLSTTRRCSPASTNGSRRCSPASAGSTRSTRRAPPRARRPARL